MDLTKFEYPMFSTTDRDKEILRMVELDLINRTNWKGVCYVLSCLSDTKHISWGECIRFRDKIVDAIFPHPYLDSDLNLRYVPSEARILLRRIWITKLLAYKE